ncbi:MAG: SIS domain-containing protein [Chloroflexi bacterium]|nr:SIS domain-containing protein [Chloroflexota bacterium]
MPDFIDTYLTQLEEVIHNTSRADITAVVDALEMAWREGRQIFLIGNGGSAATASHMMNDLCKLTIAPGKPRVRALALTDNVPLMTAWGNDAAYDDIFVEPLLNFMRPGDLVIAISTSGNSPNVVKAVRVAKEHGLKTIGFVGDQGGKLAEMADLVVRIPSPHIGQQEDGHMILDHVIAGALRERIRAA